MPEPLRVPARFGVTHVALPWLFTSSIRCPPAPSAEGGGSGARRCSARQIAKPDRHEVEGTPRWLAEAREALVREGDYLAFEDDRRVRVVPLQEGWTRIGRSLSAHVRFDDPTVSRRHALLYRDESGAGCSTTAA